MFVGGFFHFLLLTMVLPFKLFTHLFYMPKGQIGELAYQITIIFILSL